MSSHIDGIFRYVLVLPVEQRISSKSAWNVSACTLEVSKKSTCDLLYTWIIFSSSFLSKINNNNNNENFYGAVKQRCLYKGTYTKL